MVKKAESDSRKRAKLKVIKAEEERIEKHKSYIKYARDMEFFENAIEAAAKSGKRSYSIDMATSHKDPFTSLDRLKRMYIKKYLKDFNPKFQEIGRDADVYNYDGDIIDTNRYYAWQVTFTW